MFKIRTYVVTHVHPDNHNRINQDVHYASHLNNWYPFWYSSEIDRGFKLCPAFKRSLMNFSPTTFGRRQKDQ